eukprot:gene36935-22619_t
MASPAEPATQLAANLCAGVRAAVLAHKGCGPARGRRRRGGGAAQRRCSTQCSMRWGNARHGVQRRAGERGACWETSRSAPPPPPRDASTDDDTTARMPIADSGGGARRRRGGAAAGSHADKDVIEDGTL